MFTAYRSVLREPGAAAFCVTGLVMRLPIAMYPVGLVLLVSLRTGQYAFGGYLTAAYVVGSAVGSPVVSRVADRRGQRAVLIPSTLVHIGAVAALLLLVEFGAGRAWWVVAGVIAGFFYLSVGAFVRARWVRLLGGTTRLGTALSIESTLDELVFTIGPIIATVLATALDPAVPLALAAGLVLVGALLLHVQRRTEPPPIVVERRDRRPLPAAPMLTLVLAMVAVGATFGSVELAAIAFVGQAGLTSWTGLVIGCFAFGSGVAGLIYGARRWRAEITSRFRIQAVVFGLLPALLLAAPNVPTLAGFLFVVGLATAPLLIVGFGLIEQLAPANRLTEAMTWLITGIAVGYGITAPVVGVIADDHGARIALLVPVGTAALVLVVGLVAATVAVRYHARQIPDVAPACHDEERAALS